jgi:hypothetical protein
MPSEIETMPAGPVLDSEVVRNVFGWRRGDGIHAARDHVWDEGEWIPQPRFSTDPRAMTLVLERLSVDGACWKATRCQRRVGIRFEIKMAHGRLHENHFECSASADTLPLAVTRAALAYARSRKLPPPGAVNPQAAPGPL